jgi:hypothetical protein
VGFFDFLKLQGEDACAGRTAPLPEGTQASTGTVTALLEVPKPARGQAWTRQFMAHVADAAFFSGNPSIVQGADRLPFFALRSGHGDQPFPSHVIHHMQEDFLLDQGLGVVINPAGQEADWAFTYGDILNFSLYGVFYPVAAGSQIRGLSPQARLPQPARKAMRAFLQQLGVAAPGVRFAAWDHAGPGSLELVFKFSPQEFNRPEDFPFAMSHLNWFLPRNYSYSVAGNLATQEGDFQPL